MITMKTADLLGTMAMKLQAISEAVYESGFKAEANSISQAASILIGSSNSLEDKITAYVKASMNDAPMSDDTQKPVGAPSK